MNPITEPTTPPQTAAEAMVIIAQYRQEIDCEDTIIQRALSRRTIRVREIGRLKALFDIPVFDANREAQQFERLSALARTHGDSVSDTMCVFKAIISRSKQIQMGCVSESGPIIPKRCAIHGWRTSGILHPERVGRVCPVCMEPLV